MYLLLDYRNWNINQERVATKRSLVYCNNLCILWQIIKCLGLWWTPLGGIWTHKTSLSSKSGSNLFLSLENLQERNHQKRYELVEKFVEAKFPEMKIPNYIRTLDYEKMEWFNSILNQLWPFIGDYVRLGSTFGIFKGLKWSYPIGQATDEGINWATNCPSSAPAED